jgi:RHS repeat-associated protein
MNTAAYTFNDTAPLQTATRLRVVTGAGYAANDETYEPRTIQLLPLPNPLPQVGEGVNVARCAAQPLDDANNNTSTYIYDGRNLLLTESRPLAAISNYQYDKSGNRTQLEDPEHRINTWAYDLRNRVKNETNGENETTSYTYDDNGNRLTVQRPNGNTWTSVFDAANRLTSITDPLSGITSYSYDPNSNRLSQTDANGNKTAYEYDVLNRQTAMVYADSARASFGYDENGNRTSLTDAKGQAFGYAFDALNRLKQSTYPLPAAPTGDDLQSIGNDYDANGNLTQVQEVYSGISGTRTTARNYDNFDRLTAVTDGFNKTLRYLFDANGNRTALTDPDNKVTRYTFDALNRVNTVSNTGGTTLYDYDRSSLKTKVTYPNGTTAATTYDRARRILTLVNRQGAAPVSSYSYTYDANGNRLQQIENVTGSDETTSYAFDNNDRLTTVNYPDKQTAYTFDNNANRKTEITTAGGATTQSKTYSYNNRNQLTTVADNLNAANSAVYGFDANGNQTSKTQNSSTTNFAYDVKDQLLSVNQNNANIGVFSYDYQGHRIVKDMGGSIVRYAYDGSSVLVETDTSGSTLAKFDYGPDRLLSMNHATEGRAYYLFDALGSVANLTTSAGGIQARYQYDAFGNYRSTAGASFNRFAFTGHEKDNETNLYYFKARFYDPETGRFLNQDAYLGDINTPPSLHRYLYAYSNPTVYVDLFGYSAFSCAMESDCTGDSSDDSAGLSDKQQVTADKIETSIQSNIDAKAKQFEAEGSNAKLNTLRIGESLAKAGGDIMKGLAALPAHPWEVITGIPGAVKEIYKGVTEGYSQIETAKTPDERAKGWGKLTTGIAEAGLMFEGARAGVKMLSPKDNVPVIREASDGPGAIKPSEEVPKTQQQESLKNPSGNTETAANSARNQNYGNGGARGVESETLTPIPKLETKLTQASPGLNESRLAYDPNHPQTRLRAELYDGITDFTDINSEALGKGRGPELMEKGINDLNINIGKEFHFSSINNPPTWEAWEATGRVDGSNAANSVLGKTGIRAAERLGIEVDSAVFQSYKYGSKVRIIFTTK